MTHEELDAMWSIATRKSIEENQPYTRYEFAKMVAAKEREACVELCLQATPNAEMRKMMGDAAHYVACANAIRARGEA